MAGQPVVYWLFWSFSIIFSMLLANSWERAIMEKLGHQSEQAALLWYKWSVWSLDLIMDLFSTIDKFCLKGQQAVQSFMAHNPTCYDLAIQVYIKKETKVMPSPSVSHCHLFSQHFLRASVNFVDGSNDVTICWEAPITVHSLANRCKCKSTYFSN